MSTMLKVKILIFNLSTMTSNGAGDYNPDVETNLLQFLVRCKDSAILWLEYVDILIDYNMLISAIWLLPITLLYHIC